MNAAETAPNIMIVDDEPANLKLLEEMLRREGYRVRSFPRGRLALAAAEQDAPDLILLDINMPELSGYEVCERLKASSALASIPVIFLSALQETADKLNSFRFGGVDYISKPFQVEEVYARLATHLKLSELQRAMKQQNAQLEKTIALRTRELAEAHARLTKLDTAKDDFLKIISHEFRTPLFGVLGSAELALQQLLPSAKSSAIREMFERSRRRTLALLDDAVLLTQIDINRADLGTVPVDVDSALHEAMNRASDFAESRQVRFESPPPGLGFVQGDGKLLASALQSLLETAVKFSREGGTVRTANHGSCDSPGVTISSEGRMIPQAAIDKFFDIFSIAEALTPGGDLGLAPAVASRILSLFGGAVAVANCDPAGIQLSVSFQPPAFAI
jgi:DNA-binding response OmpR family regulator